MIFVWAKKLCDDSLDLRLSSDDNVKSAGPPQRAWQDRIWTPFRIKKIKLLFLSNSKSDLIQTWTNRKVLVHSFFWTLGFLARLKKFRESLISMSSNFMSPIGQSCKPGLSHIVISKTTMGFLYNHTNIGNPFQSLAQKKILACNSV